jgi:hypothetical protein
VTRKATVQAWFLAPACSLWLTASVAQATGGTPAATPASLSSIPTAAPATASPIPPLSADSLPEVTVERDEPQFVAPTRRDRIGRIWAPVMIDGKGPFRLVLDTGANHSAVIQRTADALNKPQSAETAHVTGVTGSATVPTLRVGSMEVGELLLGPTFLPILPDVFGGAQGVLGREGLANMRIVADFGNDRLTITRSRGQRTRGNYSAVPLQVVHDGLLMANVLVGRVPTRAIIDTGAQRTIGNEALREALQHHPYGRATTEDIVGVTLDVQQGDNQPSPPIALGNVRLEGVRITFGDMYLFEHWKMTAEPTLLIGMDMLGSFDLVVIDYRTHELDLRQRPSMSNWKILPIS